MWFTLCFSGTVICAFICGTSYQPSFPGELLTASVSGSVSVCSFCMFLLGNLSIPHCFSLSLVGHLSILVIIRHIAVKLPLRGYLYLIDSHSS